MLQCLDSASSSPSPRASGSHGDDDSPPVRGSRGRPGASAHYGEQAREVEHFSPGRTTLTAVEWVLKEHFLEEAEAERQSRKGRMLFSTFASRRRGIAAALLPGCPSFRAGLGPAAQTCLLRLACIMLPPQMEFGEFDQ